jgi:hypothetical protein
MRIVQKTAKPIGGPGRRPGDPGSPSSRADAVRAGAVFGIALGRSARAKAALTVNAKAASAHILALTVDHGLIAAGVAAAIGSASFAGFTMTRDNSHPLFGGVEHLMIFAQPSSGLGGDRRLLLERVTRSVDYDATGSIDRTPQPRPSADVLGPARGDDIADATGARAKGYVLRFTPKGAMVVDGAKGSYAATPGVVVPDMGRILAIQNRNGRWVVMTENGIINEASR